MGCKGKNLSRQEQLSSLSYFDVLAGLAVLAMASVYLSLAVVDRPGWLWNYKDAFGLGLLLGTTIAFILLRRRVSAPSMPWLRGGLAGSIVTAGVVLFRRWEVLWLGMGALLLLFALCLRSKPGLARPEGEDIYKILLVVGSLLGATILAEGSCDSSQNCCPKAHGLGSCGKRH